MTVASYVRVGSDNRAATPKVDLSKLSEEELSAGLYIPTQERFFRNAPDDDGFSVVSAIILLAISRSSSVRVIVYDFKAI